MKHPWACRIAACLALTAAGPLHAQEGFRLGAQFGMNSADAKASPLAQGISVSVKKGWIAGLHCEYGFDSMFTLSISPRFVEKGAKLLYRDALSETVLYNYLEAPVALRIVLRDSRLAPFILVGFTPSLLVSARYFTEFQYGRSTQYVEALMHTHDFSVDAGAGMQYRVVEALLTTMSIVYAHGLVNVLLSDPGGESSEWFSRDLKIHVCVSVQL